jgi:hypothetical protein
MGMTALQESTFPHIVHQYSDEGMGHLIFGLVVTLEGKSRANTPTMLPSHPAMIVSYCLLSSLSYLIGPWYRTPSLM